MTGSSEQEPIPAARSQHRKVFNAAAERLVTCLQSEKSLQNRSKVPLLLLSSPSTFVLSSHPPRLSSFFLLLSSSSPPPLLLLSSSSLLPLFFLSSSSPPFLLPPPLPFSSSFFLLSSSLLYSSFPPPSSTLLDDALASKGAGVQEDASKAGAVRNKEKFREAGSSAHVEGGKPREREDHGAVSVFHGGRQESAKKEEAQARIGERLHVKLRSQTPAFQHPLFHLHPYASRGDEHTHKKTKTLKTKDELRNESMRRYRVKLSNDAKQLLDLAMQNEDVRAALAHVTGFEKISQVLFE
eukprot:746239-Hanusia_phi.AAC.2